MTDPTVDEIRALVAEADAARELFMGPDPHDREERRSSAMHAAEARAGSLRNVRALLAEVARLRDADAWQPIETAPGAERVLVWRVLGKHGHETPPRAIPAKRDPWGWFDDDSKSVVATHWRPLPEPPVVTREAFASDPGRYVRAADDGPVTVVGDEGPVMVLSTMEVGDE